MSRIRVRLKPNNGIKVRTQTTYLYDPTIIDKEVQQAKDWAIKTDGLVEEEGVGIDYSAKAYAIGGTGTTTNNAKYYAEQAGISETNASNSATAASGSASSANSSALLAKDWATKTDGTVDGVDYSSKYYAQQITPIATDITTVAGIASDVTTVANNSTNITTVASNTTNINKVSSDINRVNLVADDIDSVHTVAVDISTVIDVADNKTNIDAVAGDLTNIDAVANDLANIDNASTYANNAHIWAEGTDVQVVDLGGEHSSKGWAAEAKAWAESIGTVLHYKGSVATYADLPTTGQTVGDMWNVLDDGANYAWDGTDWDALSGIVDLSAYRTASDQDTIDAGKVPTTRTVNGKALSSNITLTASDVGALPDSTVIPTVNNPTITITQGGVTKGSFTLNQASGDTIALDAGVAGADTDLSNLTSTGKNIGNWSSNVTNCITEIPQDINLTLSSGTLTLKAGSKVYVPNGVGVFDVVTTSADRSLTNTSNDTYMVFAKSDGSGLELARLANQTGSGTTTPTSSWWVYYNTSDNKVYRIENGVNVRQVSLPIAIITVSGGAITSIDQAFNGFGYIGSTIFVLPGVKGLVPNGRNADGTLKNTEFTRTSVGIFTQTSGTSRMVVLCNASAFAGTSTFNYNEQENKNYSGSSITSTCSVGTYNRTNGVISNFKPKTAFHAVDYNNAVIKDANNTFTGSNTFSGAVSLGGSATATTLAYSDNDTSVATTAWGYRMLNAQRTNCITHIPQDIKLELNNGTLTLKSGSKVYVPNGVGVFDAVTTSSDKTVSVGGSTTFDGFIYYATHDNGLRYGTFSQAVSGSSYSINDGYWYDTTNNSIKRIVGGAVSYSGLSFPIALVSVVSGVITSINQIFNGFGFIGNVVFALPGVRGLMPDGRNADGTLKNNIFTISSVITSGLNASYEDAYIRDISFGWSYEYDEYRNVVHLATDKNALRLYAYLGKYKYENGKLAYFKPRIAFHALDYNDKGTIAGFGMPSSRYTDLTLGASGATYTAPANGWFYLVMTSNNSDTAQIVLSSDFISASTSGPSGQAIQCYVPIGKGETIAAYYQNMKAYGQTYDRFRFVYAKGEVDV